MPRLKRTKGGQPRNQNAKTHGFYSKVLDDAEQLDLEVAEGVQGIDDEIALLRVKIKQLIEKDPDNLRLIMEATSTIARLVRTRYNLNKGQGKGVKDAITKVLMELAIPAGIGALRS